MKAGTAAPTAENDEETKGDDGEAEAPAEEEDKEAVPGEEPAEEPLE